MIKEDDGIASCLTFVLNELATFVSVKPLYRVSQSFGRIFVILTIKLK